jgi:hypothetical protein
MTEVTCPITHKSNVFNEMNRLFKTGDNSIIKNLKSQDNNFLMEFNDKFTLFDGSICSKTGQRCQCVSNVSQDGYFIYCKDCQARLPMSGLFSNTQVFNNAFIIFGIQINNSSTNNYKAPLTLQQTYMTYPLPREYFKDDDLRVKKFQNILRTHTQEKIVDFNSMKYTYYSNSKEWWCNKEIVDERQVYEEFVEFYSVLIENLSSFYRRNSDIPMIDFKCYNEHILLNLGELYRVIDSNKENYLLLLRNHYKCGETTTPEYCSIDKFLHCIQRQRNNYIKLDEIFELYNIWKKTSKIKCIDNNLTKNQLRNIIEEYLFKNNFKHSKYKAYRQNKERFSCFKDITFIL